MRIWEFWLIWGDFPHPKPPVPKGGPQTCWLEKGVKSRLPLLNTVISTEKITHTGKFSIIPFFIENKRQTFSIEFPISLAYFEHSVIV